MAGKSPNFIDVAVGRNVRVWRMAKGLSQTAEPAGELPSRSSKSRNTRSAPTGSEPGGWSGLRPFWASRSLHCSTAPKRAIKDSTFRNSGKQQAFAVIVAIFRYLEWIDFSELIDGKIRFER